MRPPVDLERLASVTRKARSAHFFARDALAELGPMIDALAEEPQP